MSKLDKEQVLADFTEAYKKANGKAPKVEDNNGWYSIDGGKNVRLAEIEKQTAELSGTPTKKASTSKASAPKTAKKPAKATTKKSSSKAGNKKAAVKSSKSGGGLTAKEQWKKHLQDNHDARLPRGMQ